MPAGTLYSKVITEDGRAYEVTETFMTVLRYTKEALEAGSPLMELHQGDKRVAVNPREIAGVEELVRPTKTRTNGKNPHVQQRSHATRPKQKRVMSEAARKKISRAQKKRWAQIRRERAVAA